MKLIDNCKKVMSAGADLKGLKWTKGHDGKVWSCIVYLAGVRIGTAHEDSHGGGLCIDISTQNQSKLVSALKRVEYPLGDLAFEDLGIYGPTTDSGYLEWVLPKVTGELDALKKMQRAAKAKTLYQLHDDTDAEHWVWNIPFTDEVKGQIHEKHGANLKQILNETLASL